MKEERFLQKENETKREDGGRGLLLDDLLARSFTIARSSKKFERLSMMFIVG